MAEGLCLPEGGTPVFGDVGLRGLAYNLAAPMVRPGTRDLYPGYSLDHQHERELLAHFFSEVHPAIPLFRIESFLKRYDDGLVGRDLLVTIVTVAASVLSPINFWKPEDVEMCMKFLLETVSPETTSPDTHNNLDSFRLECLLAYYEFHQFPGSSSWMRISKLARRAYSVGVNQIDNPDLCSAFDSATATEDDIEDWRYLFWCIYCLDSYSNISVGTPFVVELESINTALARSCHGQAHTIQTSASKVFLPDDVEDIWKTAKHVVSNGILVNYNLHMVTTTALRQAGYIMRLRASGDRRLIKIEAFKGALAALRLSLPSRYLNPTRNVLGGESCIDHHIRLTNILHLHMTSLIIAISTRLDGNEAAFVQNWLESLESCQHIVSVVGQWDNQHSPRIDPAICLIIYSALYFLELHRRSTTDPTASLVASLDHGQNLLVLFLEQFSSMWAVPRILLQQFKKTQGKYKDTALTYAELDSVLSKFKTPLHPKAIEQSSAILMTTSDMNIDADMTMHLDELWSFDIYDFNL
ncbi:putative NADPH-dependent 1-acyldihydroxyacetone phosphate reductase [Rosellinia necatrix]|uniref:Putative NADPH-dependent 1-acyldihydroxyacetone phosphate reductase n=1 Tax=Rosellinia necatrix TaxID=77044 RepID=A0A1S7UKJ1_ROSNE|nr:putative NADPH-dependent 1-acyldihydroxyacetone phosphate reductase [Rosellinia necatrix]